VVFKPWAEFIRGWGAKPLKKTQIELVEHENGIFLGVAPLPTKKAKWLFLRTKLQSKDKTMTKTGHQLSWAENKNFGPARSD
jgi:hypothetical protein